MRPHIHSFLRFFSYRTSFFLGPSLFFLPSSLALFFFIPPLPPEASPILTFPSLLSSQLISPLADPFCLIHILSLFVIKSHTCLPRQECEICQGKAIKVTTDWNRLGETTESIEGGLVAEAGA